MLKGDDLLGADDVIANVEALDLTLLERVRQQLDIVHYNQIVANIQVLERPVALSNDLRQQSGRLAADLCV